MKKVLFILIPILLFGLPTFSQNYENNSDRKYKEAKSEAAQIYFRKAENNRRSGKPKKAEKFYLKAVEAEPGFAKAFVWLGRMLRHQERLNEAAGYCEKAIALEPDGLRAHQVLAVIYGLQKKNAAAAKECREIIRLKPESAEGYHGLANYQMLAGQMETALKNAEKAVKIHKMTDSKIIGEAYQLVGLIHFYQKNLDESRKYFEWAKVTGELIPLGIKRELYAGKLGNTQNIALKTKEDFVKCEPLIIKLSAWFMDPPANARKEQKAELSAFLLKWLEGNPKVSADLNEAIFPFADSPELRLAFLGGRTKYALESRDFENKSAANIAGIEGVIALYSKNKKALGKNKTLDKFVKMKEKGTLKTFVKEKL